jgi:hypothetical protein
LLNINYSAARYVQNKEEFPKPEAPDRRENYENLQSE